MRTPARSGLLVLSAVAAVLATSPNAGAAAPSPPLRRADGRPLDLAAFRGKTVLVNYWATWCAPCRAELPSLDRLAAREGGRLVVIAASVDTDPTAAKAAFEGRYPHLKLAHASLADLQRFGALGVPYTVVLDGRGAELRRVPRALAWDEGEGAAAIKGAR